jgi:hypothetical protein
METVREMFELVDRIPNERTRTQLRLQFHDELYGLVNKLESLYYTYYLQHRPVDALETRREEELAHFGKCMRALMPMMIMMNTELAPPNIKSDL